ncbi:hypothetical protein BD324DRAFT_620243 [Kockovaella imperatae]|uniref:N-acetyltransferase domain-containing protein n=1 Tax=Kockovaella imperatae TaxID=4999 RepID=A0A1Y1UJP1_9TREE|nr:hypothetical protein BD324DRAFT_620243 [Kockovaella imperatae]ORX38280.1 hypothetical protein BD324DRAFT_620243 [Kockovaella imperatae]
MRTPYPRVRHIEGYSDEAFNACLKVLTAAFADHPFMLMKNGHDPELLRLDLSIPIASGLQKKLVYVTGHNDHDISAVIIISPPAPPKPSDTTVKTSPQLNSDNEPDYAEKNREEYKAKLPAYIKEYMETVKAEDYKEFVKTIGEELWLGGYRIGVIGTYPSAQGQGYGSALMREIMNMAAEKKSWIALASWTHDTTL